MESEARERPHPTTRAAGASRSVSSSLTHPSSMTSPLRLPALAAALTLLPAVAAAQTTLLNQQPTQTFSLLDTLGVESNADQFVIGGLDSYDLEEVKWWGTWTGSGTLIPDTFNVLVHTNDSSGPFGDVPGTLITSFSNLAPAVAPTGASMPTATGLWPEFELSVLLPTPVTLTPGTYWVEIYSTASSGTGEQFAWENAAEDLVLGGPCLSWSSSTPGTSWNACTPFPETDMALELKGSQTVINEGAGYCYGDGTGTICPCAAFGGAGEGCLTTSGSGATLVGSGNAIVGNDGFTLDVSGAPANKPALFFQGNNQLSTVTAGDGVLCSNSSLRYAVNSTDANGNATQTGFGANAVPGQSLNYQYWFRDTGNTCGGGFNFTNGWAVTWQ